MDLSLLAVTDGAACANRRWADHRPHWLAHTVMFRSGSRKKSKNYEFDLCHPGYCESTFVRVEGYIVFNVLLHYFVTLKFVNIQLWVFIYSLALVLAHVP